MRPRGPGNEDASFQITQLSANEPAMISKRYLFTVKMQDHSI